MPPQTPITVVLSAFDDIFAGGLLELVDGDPSLEILARQVAQTRIPVILRAHRPDVAILDAGAMARLADVRELGARCPDTRLVLIAKDPSMVACAQALAFGASAYLGRDTQSRDVLHAIHLASRGLQVTPRGTDAGSPGAIAGSVLTKREAEVLPLLREGCSNAQIALALGVGVETVRTHASNIYRKLGVGSRRELGAPPEPTGALTRGPAPPARSARGRNDAHATRLRHGHGLRRG